MDALFNKGGTEYITAKISGAIKDGERRATVSGNWEIEAPVRIPSDFTLVLEDCHLRMADGTLCNMFVNEKHGTPEGRLADGADRNISVIGHGRAILDGGKYNGLSERTQRKNGLPPIWNNNLLLFTNVDGFRISDIHCRNQRWWALNFVFCRNGYIGNVDFLASDIGIDRDGNEYHGLVRDKYEEVLVKNADGIDLRRGCQNIVIENITGFTEDDTIALTALCGKLEDEFSVCDLDTDIAYVTIKNVRSAAFCTTVRLLNQSGCRLHDISIDGVEDLCLESPYTDHGLYTVRVGDTRLYGTRHATEDETYNISIRNVKGGGDYVVSLAGAMKNITLEGIEAVGATPILLDERVKNI